MGQRPGQTRSANLVRSLEDPLTPSVARPLEGGRAVSHSFLAGRGSGTWDGQATSPSPDPLHNRWREGISGGKAHTVIRKWHLRQGVGVVSEGFEQVEEEVWASLFSSPLSLAAKLGEGVQAFSREVTARGIPKVDESHEGRRRRDEWNAPPRWLGRLDRVNRLRVRSPSGSRRRTAPMIESGVDRIGLQRQLAVTTEVKLRLRSARNRAVPAVPVAK